MNDTHPIVGLLIQVGAAAAALTGIAIFIERIWGPMRRWLANALTNPLLDKLDEVKEDMEDQTHYMQYHLGPNGQTQPLHMRVEDVRTIATAMAAVAKDNQRRLTMIERYLLLDQPGQDEESD